MRRRAFRLHYYAHCVRQTPANMRSTSGVIGGPAVVRVALGKWAGGTKQQTQVVSAENRFFRSTPVIIEGF